MVTARFPAFILVGVLCNASTPAALSGPPPQQAPVARPPAEADDLAPVRELMAEGRWNDAWTALATTTTPPSAANLELQIEVALRLDRPADALSAWSRLQSPDRDAIAMLRQIAVYTTHRLLESKDALVRAESERVLATLGERDARVRLQRRMDDQATQPLERLAAAAALASAGDAAAVTKFAVLAQGVAERERYGLVRLAGSMPDQVALKLLTPMLKSARSDVRYSAVLALADRGGADVVRVLRDFLTASPEGAARLAAMLALAVHGDRAMLASLGAIASQFGDRETLEYARALLAAGDPQGQRYLGVVQNSDDELLRLEAAALVARSSPATGRDLLVGALGHANVWVRLRALELLRGLMPQPNTFVHLLVAPDDWLRLRSAELVLAVPPVVVRRAARP